jgi:flagellar basal-body rod protein FlgB
VLALTASTTAIITKTLDALSLRYSFTAQNIANANTPDYRAVHLSFEDGLRAAAAQGDEALAQFSPQPVTAGADPADAMRLDLEVASASQTALRYRSLIELLSRQFALSRTAIDGGR